MATADIHPKWHHHTASDSLALVDKPVPTAQSVGHPLWIHCTFKGVMFATAGIGRGQPDSTELLSVRGECP